jgi:hypothetical protein
MSSEVKDGGPAFPSVGEGFNNPLYSAPGMSLRDWFAGQALAGLMADENTEGFDWEFFARQSYAAADAMLSARQQKDKNDGR